ncbi:MAG: U32 family peptidase [Acidobacteria bacterium]|nr:U32 family peptidase [Acidobacteriota bacterium]
MRLLAPTNHPDEVEMLVGSGAHELYCGVVPGQWTDRHSLAAPINRRGSGPGNMQTLGELRDLVDTAHRLGALVHLALNAATYNEAQVPFLCGLAAEAADEIGIDALIVADVGLLSALMGFRPGLRVHVSSLAAVHNSQAVRFFRDLGASRVILPRQTRVDEAVAMARAVPDVELEVFILNDGCIYEEGHCSTVHSAGPICLTDWGYSFRPVGAAGELSAADLDVMADNARAYGEWIGCHVGQADAVTPTGVPSGPCGLCAIPALHRGGVHSLKVIGREAPAYKKLRSVQQVRAVMDGVSDGKSAQECRALAQAIRGTPELCRSGFGCYYPEVVRMTGTTT